MMQQPAQSYDSVAKWLHWLTVLGIFLLLLGGPIFHFMPETEKISRAASGHAGLGTLVLILMSVRLYWRSRNPVAAPAMPGWQARLSLLVHRLLYACVLLQPTLGILMAMTSPYDVVAFGYFNYSALVGANETWYQIFHICHRLNGALLALTVLLHIAAAIYHQLVIRDNLLARMLPQRVTQKKP
ncbi:MAG: cytochrome b561 [Porticoccaceae bacterium]|jgi:cytochrome b561